MDIEIKISKKPVNYKKALQFLEKRVNEVKNGTNKELLWILEHPTTYTAGISFNEKEIIDKKRIKIILKRIKKKSINKGIDPKITNRIWKNMIWSFIDYEKKVFKKK